MTFSSSLNIHVLKKFPTVLSLGLTKYIRLNTFAVYYLEPKYVYCQVLHTVAQKERRNEANLYIT